jgi:hypothetical protein
MFFWFANDKKADKTKKKIVDFAGWTNDFEIPKQVDLSVGYFKYY